MAQGVRMFLIMCQFRKSQWFYLLGFWGEEDDDEDDDDDDGDDDDEDDDDDRVQESW